MKNQSNGMKMLVIIVLLSAVLAGCKKTSGEFSNKTEVTGTTLELTQKGEEKVLETNAFRMEFNDSYSEFSLTDSKNQNIWYSSMSEENFDISSINAMWNKKLSSLFHISYTNLEKGLGAIVSSPLLAMDYTAMGEIIEDGLAVTYSLSQPNISVTLYFTLDETGLKVKIPANGIEEHGDFAVVSLDILPYFAGATDTTEGYYFYPDGSGAIMEFTDNSHQNEKTMNYDVYGNIEDYSAMGMDFSEEAPLVMLPVFGAKMGQNGFLAVITQGEENSRISLNCSNDVVAVNGLWCQFLYRRGFEDPRVKTKSVLTYDKLKIEGDREVYYRFLDQGNTDYSAMAANYRTYLMDQGVEYALEGKELPLMLDIFLGIEEQGLLFNDYKAVTSFEQGIEILNGFANGGVSALETTLKGWTKNGYQSDPKQFPVSGKLGGGEGLEDFLSVAKDQNISVSLEANVIEARSSYSGFSKRNDVIYLGNHMILTDKEEDIFLLSPNLVGENSFALMEEALEFELQGIRFNGIGSNLYYNYNSDLYLNTVDCKKNWKKILQQSKNNYELTATVGGNAYVFGNVQRLSNIPSDDRGYMISTKEIPFYQMIVHGMAGYTGVPGNLTSDLSKEKLKWIEYGYLPYFELTYEGSEALMYTEYNSLFSSKYSEWKDRILEVYKEMNESIGDLWTKQMIKHECVQTEVYRIIYSDNTKVYVNYSNEDVTVDGQLIKAMDYAVVREGKE